MIDEQFEFRLSQYLDGTLPVDEAAAFFEELSKSPAALAMLDEYRRLDLLLKAQPTTEINWTGLAEDISGQIDEASRVKMRIGFFASPLRMAAAACVLLAVGIAGWIALRSNPGGGITPRTAVAKITGPTAEVATAPAVSQIEIGPAPTVAINQTATYHYAELSPQAARVIIASGVDVRQDERTLPY